MFSQLKIPGKTQQIKNAGAFFQPKLAISQPNDVYEKEADKVAGQIVNKPDSENNNSFFKPAAQIIQRKCAHCEEEEKQLQRKSDPGKDDIHDPLLDKYSEFSGQPRETVSQHDPGYENWILIPNLKKELQKLIDGATWPEIRKRVYPKESAAGIQRAKDRHTAKLPDLTGLGRLSTLDHFAAAIKTIQRNWTILSTPDKRTEAIGKAANNELTSANVPEFKIVNKEPMGYKGYFSKTDWRFAISEQLVTNNSLMDDDAGEVANTALHESRHAEQQFLSARFSAGINNFDAPALAVEQHIPDSIAAIAVTNKFDASTDAATQDLGKQMYQADVIDAAKNADISNDDGWNDMADRRKEAEAALLMLNTESTYPNMVAAMRARDALKAQVLVVEQKYALYRRIPYEADAHEVGDAAEQAFLGWPSP